MLYRLLYLIIGVIIISPNFSTAQPTGIQNRPPAPMSEQEFRTKINTIADEDSVLELYVEFANQNIRRYPDKVLALSDELLDLERAEMIKRLAYHNHIRAMYWDRPDPDSALKYLRLAEQQFDQLGQHERAIGHIINQARSNNRLNNFLISEGLYFRALEYIEENDLLEFDRRRVLNEMSDLYVRLGATDIALTRLTELLEMGASSMDEECNIRLKISNARKRANEIDQAVEQLMLCSEVNELNPSLKVAIYRSLSDLEKVRGNQNERLSWVEKAAEFNLPIPSRNIPTYLFLAEAYFDNALYAKADSVIKIMESIDQRRVQIPTRANLAVLKAKSSLQNDDPVSAIQHASEGLQLVERMPQSLIALDLQRLLAEAHEKNGNFETAYTLLKELEDRERRFEDLGRIRQEEESKVRFQMRAKNQEIDDITSELGSVRARTYLIVFLVVLLSGFLIYRYRILSALREEKTRIKIASDLHDEVSATLTGISYFAEAVKTDQDDEKKNHFINLITESAGDAKEKITDIVWSISPENDDWDIFLSKCRRYASDLLESRGIEYELKIADTISGKLEMNTRQHLWMIFKEMLTNVVRHSKAKRVDIIMDTNHQKFKMVMQDDGIGFDTNGEVVGNGLKNIEKRAKSIGANLELDSEPSIGTRWTLELTL